MASNYKYIAQFYDIEQVLHTVTIERPAVTDAEYLIQYSDHNAVEVAHRGGGKDTWDVEVIQGQELTFQFWLSRDDVGVLDGIFESAYHEYRLTYEIGGAVEFIGWIKPENLTKRYEKNPPYIEISMSATDGLAELKHIEFRDILDEEKLIQGNYSILTLIKKALDYVGFQLDFKIQLNTYEVIGMASTACLLDQVRAKADRFLKENGEDKQTVMSCWDVIHYLLLDFNVKFFQHKGFYYIIKFHEKDSFIYTFNYNTLLQASRVSNNLVKDITAFLYKPYIEQQKIHPLKSILLAYEDVDVGGDATGLDLELLTSYTTTFNSIQYVNALKPEYGFTLTKTNSSPGILQLLSTFNVTMNADGQDEYLKFEFDYRVMSIVSTGGTPEMELLVEVLRPNGLWSAPVMYPLYITDLDLPGGGWISPALNNYLHESFKIVENGEYNVRLTFRPKPNYGWVWTTASFQIKNIRVLKIIGGAQYPYDPVSVNNTRKYYQINIGGYQKLEVDTLFGDGGVTDLGSFLIGATSTSLWTPYGEAASIKIIDLYSRTVLLNRSKYKNYLRFSIIDRGHTIHPNQVLTIENVDYVINSWSKNYRSGELELELVELITGLVGDGTYEEFEEEIQLKSGTITYGGTELPPEGQYQEAHGFALGDLIRFDFTTLRYVKAQADIPENAKTVGIVSEVISVDLFKYISDGYISKDLDLYAALNLIEGEYYFLSPTVAGAMVTIDALVQGNIEQCIGFVTSKGFQIEIDARNIADGLFLLEPDGWRYGGLVTWLTGLTFSISPAGGYLGGQLITAPYVERTALAADPTYDKIIAFVLDISGESIIVEGIPSAFPLMPTIDPATQIYLTHAIIPANATEPIGIANELVYDENAIGEWTPSSGSFAGLGPTLDWASPTDPFNGLICAEITNIERLDYLKFVAPEVQLFTEHDTLSFSIRLKATLPLTHNVFIALTNGAAIVTNYIRLDLSRPSIAWQRMIIAMNEFVKTGTSFDGVLLMYSSVNAGEIFAGFYLDYMFFQGGLDQPEEEDTFVIDLAFDEETRILTLKQNNGKDDIGIMIPGGDGGGIPEIPFEFCVTSGVAETFDLDIYVTSGYTISKAILKSDGVLQGVQIKIGAMAITGLNAMEVGAVAVFTATAGNITIEGNSVTLETSGVDTGTPTVIKGKLVLE